MKPSSQPEPEHPRKTGTGARGFEPPDEAHAGSARGLRPSAQFIIALAVVLLGVSLGSLIVIRQSQPGQSQRPWPAPRTNPEAATTNQVKGPPAPARP